MKNKKVAIIGLGLMGGSLARALNEKMGIREITAVNRSIGAIDHALRDGCISRGFTEINEHVWNSDIIFICTPIKNTFEYIDLLAKKAGNKCIITDMGSTKADIVKYVNGLPSPPCFIGGHPMAGSEMTGYASGTSHLFENAYYILTPCKSTTDYALECMKHIITGIGGIPLVLDAHEHDMITAGISHVPHIIASALVNTVKNVDTADGKMQMLAAGGFKDITRIASSSPEVWESIVFSNKTYVKSILHKFKGLIEDFENSLDKSDSKSVYDFFESARNYRNSIPAGKKSLISQSHYIIADVMDKPGIIGRIATILGNNNINIKNINVSNSREFEQGCLIITFQDAEDANFAFDLLQNSGYKVYKNS